MSYYLVEVCRLHQITEDEYKTRVIAEDMSIYLPQPNPKFAPTDWFDRAAFLPLGRPLDILFQFNIGVSVFISTNNFVAL
jgi:hypothetical protein